MSRIGCLPTLLLSLAAAVSAQPAGVRGNWRTPGGAVIGVAPCGTDPKVLCATILQVEPNAPAHVDGKNPDPAMRTRSLCGLKIGYGFQLTDPDHAEDGHLYDPKSGKTYRGSMTDSGDQLSLRGYMGIKAFGRTEQWTRTNSSPSCS